MSLKTLRVIYNGWGESWWLGTLADDGRRVLFEYSPEARLKNLSLSPFRLPLQHIGAFKGEPFFMGLPGLIADALPDGWGLILMDRYFRKLGKNPAQVSVLDRLALLGHHAMGALSFEPEVIWHKAHHPPTTLGEWAGSISHFVQGKDDDLINAEEGLKTLLQFGGSPQGARPKVLLNFNPDHNILQSHALMGNDDHGFFPWIFKFPAQSEHAEVCAIEELYARIARRADINMPATRFFDLGVQPSSRKRLSAFGVARFDRVRHLGIMVRVPIHSLSGLLHADFRYPSLDYDDFLRATRALTCDEREVLKAFRLAVFNVLMHNRDDHARNVAWCLDANRQWQLSPAFDLTFSEGHRGEHTMTIMGEGRHIQTDHLLTLAHSAGISAPVAKHTIEALRTSCKITSDDYADLPIRTNTIKTIIKTLALGF